MQAAYREQMRVRGSRERIHDHQMGRTVGKQSKRGLIARLLKRLGVRS